MSRKAGLASSFLFLAFWVSHFALARGGAADSQSQLVTHKRAHVNGQTRTHSSAHETVHTTTRTSHETAHARHARASSTDTAHVKHTHASAKKTVAVVTRDRHGHKHTIFKQVTVQDSGSEPGPTHKERKRVAVLLRDKHGHLHRVFRTQLVDVPEEPIHSRHSGIAQLRHTASSHSLEHAANLDDRAEVLDKSKKAMHDDGEPKPDGAEPERNNPSYGKAYALYDEGANARISGDYALAINNLGRALATVPANSHGGPSVLQLNMEYDLAQAAEAQGDMALAARYYARALSDRPNFTEAAVRLATVLARAGNYGDATKAARAAVLRSPNDPRTHAILSVILEKSGFSDEAKIEKQKTKALLANIHSLDAAPLVSPEVVSPANSQDSDRPAGNQSDSDMQKSSDVDAGR